jgi:hypothetical protein
LGKILLEREGSSGKVKSSEKKEREGAQEEVSANPYATIDEI